MGVRRSAHLVRVEVSSLHATHKMYCTLERNNIEMTLKFDIKFLEIFGEVSPFISFIKIEVNENKLRKPNEIRLTVAM